MSFADKKSPWVKMVPEKDGEPAHSLCERCETRKAVPMNVSVEKWGTNIGEFVRVHRKCETPHPRSAAA